MNDREIALWHWLSRQGPKSVLVAFDHAKIDRDLFFEGVAQLRHKIEKAGRRKTAPPLDELGKIHELRFERMKKLRKAKKSPKAAKIERQFYAIQGLRKKGASWPDILNYLKRYHRVEISRGHFHKIWAELLVKYSEETTDDNE